MLMNVCFFLVVLIFESKLMLALPIAVLLFGCSYFWVLFVPLFA